MGSSTWVTMIAAFVTALATAVIASWTIVYARATQRILEQTRESVAEAKKASGDARAAFELQVIATCLNTRIAALQMRYANNTYARSVAADFNFMVEELRKGLPDTRGRLTEFLERMSKEGKL